MAVLGNAIADYLSKLAGLYSVELPVSLQPEINDLVQKANSANPRRALFVTSENTAPAAIPSIGWEQILGWRTSDDRIFVWCRGVREPDTSFRSVVRPFISNRFPGANGGECTRELLVRLCISELWRRRGIPPVGDSFDAFLDTALWVSGVLEYMFELSGGTPSMHWSDRFLEHWSDTLNALDQELQSFESVIEPRHAWEVVRISGLPLPSAIVEGNPFLAAPKPLKQKDWGHLADVWDDVVRSFILPEGGIALLLSSLDQLTLGAEKTSSWRDLAWRLSRDLSYETPAPLVGSLVFRDSSSPSLLTSTAPAYPIAPIPSWWGVSSDELERAMEALRQQTGLAPDRSCAGLVALTAHDNSPFLLNTRHGAIAYAHTAKKWRGRVSVPDVLLRFKEDWRRLFVGETEPQASAYGDAWINPDSVEVGVRGATVETTDVRAAAGDRLEIRLGLRVEYVAARDTRSGSMVGSWNPARTLTVKVVVRRSTGSQWDNGRTVETAIQLVIPGPFSPTLVLTDGRELLASAPGTQDEFTVIDDRQDRWTCENTPTIVLKEDGRYDLHVYDGTLQPTVAAFSPSASPELEGVPFTRVQDAVFNAISQDLDDGSVVSDSSSGSDIASFKVGERSGNLSSGLLSAVRGLPAGRKEPSSGARDSLLGRYQDRVASAIRRSHSARTNSLYQYVISSSSAPVTWPDHDGTPAPMFLVEPSRGRSLPGIGSGVSNQVTASAEWQIYMRATTELCDALGMLASPGNAWLSGIDLGVLRVGTVRAYVEAHTALVRAAKRIAAADFFWTCYPFSILVVDGTSTTDFGQLLAVLLSPLHPARLAWSYALTTVARSSSADPNLLALAEGWNIPNAGFTVNLAGQFRSLVAVPVDPGSEQDFAAWSALAVLSETGAARLPAFGAGQLLPWGGPTGINGRVIERAVRDYLVVHPHVNSLEVDIRSVSPSPRSHEIDDAVLEFIGGRAISEVDRLGGGARIFDSEDRQGPAPTRDELFARQKETQSERPFEWRSYSQGNNPSEADMALVENASVHLAIVPGTTEGILGPLPIHRFPAITIQPSSMDQNFSPRNSEDRLGLANLLREIESPDSSSVALRASPLAHALGIGRGARWEIIGTFNLDPALLSSVVAGLSTAPTVRLLWEWRPSWMPLEKKRGELGRRPYYVVARIPASLVRALQVRQGFSPASAVELLRILGYRGIGLATLSAQGGTQESAAAGFFYAMQLLMPPSNKPQVNLQGRPAPFLTVLPIDPIEPILQSLLGETLERRADFLAIATTLSDDGSVRLCCVPVEVKHHGMPSRPESIPASSDTELKRARQQLAQTAEVMQSIALSLSGPTSASDVAGKYLKRVALAKLLDLAMSFSTAPAEASARGAILRAALAGSITIGVGESLLFWFAPGSVQTSGAPCVVDRYGPVTQDGVRIHELYIDPSTIAGLWWASEQVGQDASDVRSQLNAAMSECFGSCAATSGVVLPDLGEAFRDLLGEVSWESHPEPDGTRAEPVEASQQSVEPGPAATGHSEATHDEMSEPVAPPAASGSSTVAAPDIAPRALIGWASSTPRWATIGRLSSNGEPVAFDLDHPKTVGIFGYMGSGKSYLLGDLVEAAVEPIDGVNLLPAPLAVVIFNYRRNATDRFELASLAEPNDEASEVERLRAEYGATPRGIRDIQVLCLPGELRPERLQEYGRLLSTELFFDPRSLDAEDWELLMGEPGSEAVFARTIRHVLVDMRSAGEITLQGLEHQTLGRLSGQSRTAAQLRFDFIRRYLSPEFGISFQHVLSPGRVLIFDLRQPLFNKDDALRFFLVCANQISKVQGQFNKLIVFDEAHEYMSAAFGDRMEARIRLMRHEGTSYVFATQDVASIPSSVSKFLTTRFVFDLGTRENSQDLEEVAPEFRGLRLTGITAGHCLVQAHPSVNNLFARPREIDVRPRMTQHGGRTRIFSS